MMDSVTVISGVVVRVVVIVLVSVLVIGMVIGFLISGRMTSTRVERMKNYYTDIGFNREFMSILRPSKRRES